MLELPIHQEWIFSLVSPPRESLLSLLSCRRREPVQEIKSEPPQNQTCARLYSWRRDGGFARQRRKVAKRLRPLIIILVLVVVKMKGFALYGRNPDRVGGLGQPLTRPDFAPRGLHASACCFSLLSSS